MDFLCPTCGSRLSTRRPDQAIEHLRGNATQLSPRSRSRSTFEPGRDWRVRLCPGPTYLLARGRKDGDKRCVACGFEGTTEQIVRHLAEVAAREHGLAVHLAMAALVQSAGAMPCRHTA